MFMVTEWSQTHIKISGCVNFVPHEWTSPHEHFKFYILFAKLSCLDHPGLRTAPMWDLAVAAKVEMMKDKPSPFILVMYIIRRRSFVDFISKLGLDVKLPPTPMDLRKSDTLKMQR